MTFALLLAWLASVGRKVIAQGRKTTTTARFQRLLMFLAHLNYNKKNLKEFFFHPPPQMRLFVRWFQPWTKWYYLHMDILES